MANSQRIVVASRSSKRIEELGVAISEGKAKEPGPGKNVVRPFRVVHGVEAPHYRKRAA